MHLLRVLNHIDLSRIQPSVAVVRSGGNYEDMLRQDLPIHRLTANRIASSTLSTVSAAKPLRSLVKSLRPRALVCVLDPAIAVAYVATRGLSKQEIPKLIACAQNNFAAESRDRKIGGKLLQPIINRAYRKADLVVALSQGVAENLWQTLGGLQGPVRVIPNAAIDDTAGVNIEASIDDEIPRKPDERFLLVACGRLVRQKGYPYLLQAIARIKSQFPIELWILGDGTDLEELRKQCDALEISGNVKFLGFQRNPQRIFAQADLFVLSSLWEGFGNVLVEAMSQETPVLSTDCPFGPSEIITDKVNGFLVPAGSADALAAGIAEAYANRDRLRSVAAAGKQRAMEFRSSVIAESYTNAILETCK
jgi:glycosyltransferase involved in cell wall biosynthesis